ncbi:MAG TPA: H(+)/Cl(-) exchange transporter ClcA [Candidatus Xenobia bacterium]
MEHSGLGATSIQAPDLGDGTQQVLAQEAASYRAARLRLRRLVPRAGLVGVLAWAVGVAFRDCLVWAEDARDAFVYHLHAVSPWAFGWLLAVVVPGCMVSVWLVRRFAPEAAGSGIPHLKAIMHGARDLAGWRVLPIKFLGGVLGIGCGMALGREGPTTQMGGALGQMLADAMEMGPRERLTLIAAGAGAGLTAAFNAPIAGTIFVLEEMQRDFTPGVFVATLVATVIADAVTRVLSHSQEAVIAIPVFQTPPMAVVGPCLILGGLAGLLGVLYNRGLLLSLDVLPRLGWRGPMLVGISVAVSAYFYPSLVGGGRSVIDHLDSLHFGFGMLVAIWLLRYLLTMLCYGSGAPGGLFAPLLVLGALLGLGVGQAVHACWPSLDVAPAVYAVVGMAAYFTAIVRAPLTGIILIVEMTSNYNLTLPLLVGSLAAYGVAEWLDDEPIYEALLERDLRQSRGGMTLPEAMEVEVKVYAGSAFDGVAVKDLGLPPGCVLITVRRGLRTIVPNGQTVLQAWDRLTAVVGPNSAAGMLALRQGTVLSKSKDAAETVS